MKSAKKQLKNKLFQLLDQAIPVAEQYNQACEVGTAEDYASGELYAALCRRRGEIERESIAWCQK
jgi:hypothetical protein